MTDQELLKELFKAFEGALNCLDTDDEGHWCVPTEEAEVRWEFDEWIKQEHPKLHVILETKSREEEIEVLQMKIGCLQAEITKLRENV